MRRHPAFVLLLFSLTSLASGDAAGQDLPVVVLEADDLVVTESCEIVIPPGTVVADQGLEGVILVRTSDVLIRFAEGSVLRGAPTGTPGDTLSGTGIRLEGAARVTVQGARVHGFRSGIWASGCDDLLVEDADLSANFRQRLRSTPLAEDGADWLWPHENDANEWLHNYGAALYLEDGTGATVRRLRVRRGQNGIILDRMTECEVYDNDCSFLSGWGLAMWRSSRNTICRNAFDFCVRGYSHGVYNRGQDSAGILMFEQCCDNLIAENSATHGGDGFFGFAGREALGEDGEFPLDWHRRRGNNGNTLIGNDFSYAPAHGIEMTFSFGNRFLSNRLIGNAICGIWGGYSQDTLVMDNDIAENGDMGYGLERGGVNIDRSRGNRILANRFRDNRCGVHMWSLPTSFSEKPWGRANELEATGSEVAGNLFEGDEVALHLRGECSVQWGGNGLAGVGVELDLEDAASLIEVSGADLPVLPELDELPGASRPVGARPGLAGRQNIVVGPWGPWDHAEPLVLLHSASPGAVSYQAYPAGGPGEARLLPPTSSAVRLIEVDAASGSRVVRIETEEPGLHAYRAQIVGGDQASLVDGFLLLAEWKVRFFPWTVDPREDEAAWRREAEGAAVVSLPGIEFHFDHGGPEAALTGLPGASWGGGGDRFGTLAETRIPLPAGKYRIRTLSDDGIRVRVDGEAVVEDWTWHAPKESLGEFELERDREVLLEVEHFEIDGFAKLVVGLERVD